MKKTWLFYLNYFLLQWFCVRIARVKANVMTAGILYQVEYTPHGLSAGYANCRYEIRRYFALMGWVRPLSGWDEVPFKYWKNWTIRLTKIKKTPILDPIFTDNGKQIDAPAAAGLRPGSCQDGKAAK